MFVQDAIAVIPGGQLPGCGEEESRHLLRDIPGELRRVPQLKDAEKLNEIVIGPAVHGGDDDLGFPP